MLILASDRSSNLVDIASRHGQRPYDVFIADALSLPHPTGKFDFAISIAVIHHLSTKERRIEAVRELLRPLKRPTEPDAQSFGNCLIFVWALEQKNSRRGWSERSDQDVMVPWVLQQAKKETQSTKRLSFSDEQATTDSTETFQRYYHLYREGELDADISAAGGRVLESGYEKDNWWAIATPAE